jgi:uncharacterized protein (DUF1810 family)
MTRDLQRFVDAQRDVIDGALRELRAGRKTGHWIWFVFPQVAGLGHSELSRYYAISSWGEGREYLDHPILGPRLRASAEAMLSVRGRSAEQILGPVDAAKLRSSMTLFLRVAPEEPLFREVLDRYYDGIPDPRTDELLGHPAPD